MKTRLVVYFGTDGTNPTEIAQKLSSIGFNKALGAYDFEYNWDKDPNADDILSLGDQITSALKGTGANYKLTSAE